MRKCCFSRASASALDSKVLLTAPELCGLGSYFTRLVSRSALLVLLDVEEEVCVRDESQGCHGPSKSYRLGRAK